jgi:hypothetical protein
MVRPSPNPTTDPIALLDQAIRFSAFSLKCQVDAKEALAQAPPPSTGIVVVQPGESLPAILSGLTGGETVYVPPEVYTVSDLTLTKPVTLVGAGITGLVDVQAPDVRLIGCTITGPHPHGALIATADRLYVQGCRLFGSPYEGQHRGIWVRSCDVTIADTSIVNCFKQGQEAQAIAGWAGVKRLKVQRCHLEAAGENFILGGADCAQDEIPEDVLLSGCTLRKPPEWRNKGYVVKNLLEIKNGRRILVEHCTMDYSWVEGQTGFAIVLTVRNQDGTAPWSTIEDLTIRNCYIRYVAGGIQQLGTDYTHPSQLMRRVNIDDCTFEGIDPQWGANQRCFQMSWGGEDFAIRRNRFSGAGINSFLTFEGTPMTRFVFDGNTVPEGSYGIKADDTSLGTPTLEKYAPSCTWTNNTVVRSVPSNTIPYPPGTTVVAG